MNSQVEKAIKEIRENFSDCHVTAKEDGQGGAYILVENIDLGDKYTDETRHTWVGFQISFQYPFADVYPHHVRPDLSRKDQQPLGAGMQLTRFVGFDRDSVQISRRSNNRDQNLETAKHKLLKIIEWASNQ